MPVCRIGRFSKRIGKMKIIQNRAKFRVGAALRKHQTHGFAARKTSRRRLANIGLTYRGVVFVDQVLNRLRHLRAIAARIFGRFDEAEAKFCHSVGVALAAAQTRDDKAQNEQTKASHRLRKRLFDVLRLRRRKNAAVGLCNDAAGGEAILKRRKEIYIYLYCMIFRRSGDYNYAAVAISCIYCIQMYI